MLLARVPDVPHLHTKNVQYTKTTAAPEVVIETRTQTWGEQQCIPDPTREPVAVGIHHVIFPGDAGGDRLDAHQAFEGKTVLRH